MNGKQDPTDEHAYDWWALALRPLMSVDEMLTAKPQADWPTTEFYEWVELPQTAETVSANPRYEKRQRKPTPTEKARRIFDINTSLGMVQGKFFMTGWSPIQSPNEYSKTTVDQVARAKLRALVVRAESVIQRCVAARSLLADLDAGTASGCLLKPQLAFDRGFVWLALTTFQWIKPEGMRMEQLANLKAFLRKTK